MRSTNYYDNKLKKNPQIYIYNNKMMFSTSTPFFKPENSGENPEPNSNPDGNNPNGNNPNGNNPNDEEAEKKRIYLEKLHERKQLGEDYKRLNEEDSRREDEASDMDGYYSEGERAEYYITDEMRKAKQALMDKTLEFKAKDYELQKAKEDYTNTTGKKAS
jgi:hypothetical protein